MATKGSTTNGTMKNTKGTTSTTSTTTTTTKSSVPIVPKNTASSTTWYYHVIWSTILIYMTYVAIQQAYTIRLRAIVEYGPVIHEFDPYFNYRATEVRICIYLSPAILCV